MTSQGTAHARFQRAVKQGHLLHAEMAAREIGALSTSDALALVLLYGRTGNDKFERAAKRWIRRVQIHPIGRGGAQPGSSWSAQCSCYAGTVRPSFADGDVLGLTAAGGCGVQ